VDALLLKIDRLLPRSLQVKLSLLVTSLLVVLVSLIGALFSDFSESLLSEQVGRKALEVAQSVALNPAIRQGLQAGDSAQVQSVAEGLRAATGAEFIVVGDRQGVRLSHPDPQKIGQQFVGGDIRAALDEERSYASQAVGTLGPSLRGIVPVKDTKGAVAGFVAVGYLISDIEATLRIKQREILGYVAVVLLFGVFGAVVIARGLKSAIFGLEPQEIATLFSERGAIIETIREGVVAVDAKGQLTLVNQAASGYLGQSSSADLRGRSLGEICPCADLEQTLACGEPVFDREVELPNRTMVVNALPLSGGGAVASFRPLDELDLLTRELSQMQEYSEIMRAQTHEYSNKLYTIAGLIQLGALQEALDLVMTEASGYQELIHVLSQAVPDPIVSGLILGKFNRARELKISLQFDHESSLRDLPPQINREALVTILGNLLDNAFEAVRDAGDSREVRLSLTDLGEEIIFEVEDSGPGIAAEVAQTLFDKGVSTRAGSGRGMGLHLVRQALQGIGGQISYGEGDLGGALFVVSIPKQRKDSAS